MENLYETLNSKVKENIKKEKRFKQSKNNGKDYKYTKERNILVTNEMKAYFYYKYFIENILSFYLKEQIESSEELSLRKAKSQKFKFELNINYRSKEEFNIKKFNNLVIISFNSPVIFEMFSEYVKRFGEYCDENIANHYSDSIAFYFEKISIEKVLNAYYTELQRFEYIDELITSVQEEENTNVNIEKLTKNSRTR